MEQNYDDGITMQCHVEYCFVAHPYDQRMLSLIFYSSGSVELCSFSSLRSADY